MSARKDDKEKPASYLLAHDVLVHDREPSYGTDHYAARLRSWWNRAGTLPALQVGTDDYFGIVKILEFGAAKYAPRNWESGMLYSRVFRAAMDHYAGRGDNDVETGLPHRHHFLCCYMFLAAYTARGLHAFDDRPGIERMYSHSQVHDMMSARDVLAFPGFEDLAPPARKWGAFWRATGDRSEYVAGDFDSEQAARDAIDAHSHVASSAGFYDVRPL